MKIKLIIAAIMVVVLYVTVIACSAETEPTRSVTCDDFSQEQHITQDVYVSRGEVFTVALCSNPTTGFRWEADAQISDTGLVEQTRHEYLSPEDSPSPLSGAAGQEIWTFKALDKGKGTIFFEYSRPWEGGEKGEWTYTLNVTVR